MISKRLADCQRVIGYHFADPLQLEIALTHSSVRTPDRECNERLEFLGDSVLGLAITDELYRRLPDQQEGELTRIKSAVVSRGALYRASTRMGLVRFIEVAKGVGRREELPVSLTANLVESIIGAIYLDAGFFPAREFILRHLGPELEDVLNDRVAKNYKSLLQHEAQERMGVTPVYRTIEEEGPDHRRNFVVAAVLRGTEYGRASGINKKEAEQEAARHALEALQRSGKGRRRRSDGRGEGRPDARPAEGRSADPRGADLRPADTGARRDRPFGAEVDRPGQDDAAWRSWAEKNEPSRPAPAAVAPTGAYSIGPEADDGWDERPAASAAPAAPARPATSPRAEPTPPTIEGAIAPVDPSLPPPVEATGDAEPRGGRRRRRGGRGRGRAAGLEADAGVGSANSPARTSAEAPADALLADVFAEPTAAPARVQERPSMPAAPVAPAPNAVEPAAAAPSSAEPSSAEPTAVRERAPRRSSTRKPRVAAPTSEGDAPAAPAVVESADGAAAPPAPDEKPRRAPRTASARTPKSARPATESAPTPVPASAPSKSGAKSGAKATPRSDVGFGAGVDPVPAAPPPAVTRDVTVVGKVEAVKPVPKVPRPAPSSGFGDGL